MNNQPLFRPSDVELLRSVQLDPIECGDAEHAPFDDLANRLQQWLDQEANTTRLTPHPGWATVPLSPARDLIVSSAHGKYWNAYGEEVPAPEHPLPYYTFDMLFGNGRNRLSVIDETDLCEG